MAANLTDAIEANLALVEPDEGDWPTGEMIEMIVAAVRAHDDRTRPKVEVMRPDPDSPDPERWIVQIDTTADTGQVTVYLNDAPLYDADPENGD